MPPPAGPPDLSRLARGTLPELDWGEGPLFEGGRRGKEKREKREKKKRGEGKEEKRRGKDLTHTI